MNYHNIKTDDMLNGDGLRVTCWVSGCSIGCVNCYNPQTWDFNSGIPFTEDTMQEILYDLSKPYIKLKKLDLTFNNLMDFQQKQVQV